MSEYSTDENQDAPLWDGDDHPRLRMAENRAPQLVLRSHGAPAAAGVRSSSGTSARLERWVVIALCLAMAAVASYFLVDRFVLTSVSIPPRGEASGTRKGERYHVNRWRYLWFSPQRGDFVVVEDHRALSIRKVVARPSDWLSLKGGCLYVNGQKQEGVLRQAKAGSGGLSERMLQLGRDQYYAIVESGGLDGDAPHGVVLGRNILGRLAE